MRFVSFNYRTSQNNMVFVTSMCFSPQFFSHYFLIKSTNTILIIYYVRIEYINSLEMQSYHRNYTTLTNETQHRKKKYIEVPRRKKLYTILPVVLAPILKKQPAPLLMYKWSWENGMPFKFESKGRQRSTKRACKSKKMEDCQWIIDSMKINISIFYTERIKRSSIVHWR